MKKRKHALFAAATALAASLAVTPIMAADESPFQVREAQRPGSGDQKLAQGVCGGYWESRCCGMVCDMMMDGAIPRAQDPTPLPEPDSASARPVTQYRAQYHGLPGPKQHSAAGWPATVARMNTRMQWMTQTNIDEHHRAE